MKVLLIATLLMSMSAFAEEKNNENFAAVKARISANIEQRIAAIQAHKSCVDAAQDRAALQACRKTNKEARKKLKEENKGEKAEWKAGKEERKAKRKADKKANKAE